jgi:hypothetical protein
MGSSVLKSERHHTEVDVCPVISPTHKFESTPADGRKFIEDAFMPHFGASFDYDMSEEDAKNLAMFCRKELAHKLSVLPADSPTVRLIQRVMKTHESGREGESDDQKQHRFNAIKLKLVDEKTDKEMSLLEKELEELKFSLLEKMEKEESAVAN